MMYESERSLTFFVTAKDVIPSMGKIWEKMMIGLADQLTIHPDRAAARRQKIMDAARKLFLKNGFHATGVAQIAKESGVAVGQIYRDFACKEDIIAMIVLADCAEFLNFDSLRRNIEDGRIELIWTWFADFLTPISNDSEMLLAEIVAEAGRNERIAFIFKKMRSDVLDAILRALEALAPGERLAAQRKELASLIMAMSIGIVLERQTQSEDEVSLASRLALELVQAQVATMLQPRQSPNRANLAGYEAQDHKA